jgi:HEPN domain-containing protein
MGRRRNAPNDSKRYFDWLERAECDLLSAKILKDNDGDNCNAAFHCQQCIEKALKGYVLYTAGSHLDGHNLTFLCRSACKQDEKFYEWLDECAALNKYYIQTRYPTDLGFDVSDGELEKAFTMAKDMYAFIFSVISGDFTAE